MPVAVAARTRPIVTLPFDAQQQSFDNEALQKALSGKNVLSMKPEFFSQDGKTYWSIWIEYELLMTAHEKAKPEQSLTALEQQPQSLAALQTLSGFGQKKSQKYGAAIIQQVKRLVTSNPGKPVQANKAEPDEWSVAGKSMVKRIGQLFEQLVSFDNLHRAWKKARQGTGWTPESQRFFIYLKEVQKQQGYSSYIG